MIARQNTRMTWIGLAAGVLLVAAFLPWGYFYRSSSSTSPNGSVFIQSSIFRANGWTGFTRYHGAAVPNGLCVVLALAAAGLTALRMTGRRRPPRLLAPTLAALAEAHILLILYTLAALDTAAVSAGLIISVIAVTIIAAWTYLPPDVDPDHRTAPA